MWTMRRDTVLPLQNKKGSRLLRFNCQRGPALVEMVADERNEAEEET